MAQLHMQVGHTFTVALNNDTQTPKESCPFAMPSPNVMNPRVQEEAPMWTKTGKG